MLLRLGSDAGLAGVGRERRLLLEGCLRHRDLVEGDRLLLGYRAALVEGLLAGSQRLLLLRRGVEVDWLLLRLDLLDILGVDRRRHRRHGRLRILTEVEDKLAIAVEAHVI